MSNIKKISVLFLILLLFLMLSGCGIGRGFHGGYHHRAYGDRSFDSHYGPANSDFDTYSNYPNSGFCWR